MNARTPSLALASALALSATASAQEAAPAGPLRIALSAGLRGDLTSLDCAAADPPSRFTDLAARIAGSGATVTFDAGDLLGSSAVAHLATEGDLPALAEAIAATGLRALAVGHRDLGATRTDLIARARALNAQHIPMVLTNLRCEAEAQALCDVVVDSTDTPTIVATPQGSVAFIALISPHALSFIARDRSASISLTDPAEAMARATLAARAAGARYVVAQLDPDWPEQLQDTLTIAHALPDNARPDVLFSNDLSSQLAHVSVSRDGLNVVATEPGQVLSAEASTAMQFTPATAATPAPRVVSFVNGLRRRLCTTLITPMPGGHLTQPLTREGMTTLLLDVIRERSGAEIAIVNRGAVRPMSRFPLTGSITRLDVTAALPFDDSLRVGRVRGEQLETFAKSPRGERFLTEGLVRDGDDITINGRPLDPDQYYRVITTGYVADGGDGGLWGEEDTAWNLDRFGNEGPRETLLGWLSIPREGDVTTAPIDPAQRTRWTFRFVVDGAYSNTSIHNPQGYQDTQLARSASTGIDLDAEFRANAEQPRYTLDNSLRVLLGFSRTVDDTGADSGLLPSADLISGRTAFAWRGLYHRRRFWHPLPFFENYLESEFQPPTTRDFRHLQIRPTAGVRFELPARSTVSVSAGIDWESLQPGARPSPVFVARGELPPTRLFNIQDREVQGQLSTELSWRDPGLQSSDAIVRLSAKLSVPLFEPLSVTMAFDLFARQRQSDPWAISSDVNLGLQVDLLRTLQVFRY